MNFISIAFAVVTLIVGITIGYFIKQASDKEMIGGAKANADAIVDDAIAQAQNIQREALFQAKESSLKYRNEVEAELRERRHEVTRMEDRMINREENMDNREKSLDKREEDLSAQEIRVKERLSDLDKDQEKIQTLIDEQGKELERIAMLTKADAQSIVLESTAKELTQETAIMIRDAHEAAELTAERDAKEIIMQAMQRTASEIVSENTVTVISLPSDDMKGRIIGREGRNIRTFESLTGIDLIVDDTPETVVLSGFDPIRRKIAQTALERLIQDGRIHPARIEEMVDRATKEIDSQIREAGEKATFELGIHRMHPDLIKILGRLSFRTSYGQNQLGHSVEVAKLAGIIAGELGEDVTLAKRAGLMHDIGKALDAEIEGSHVEIGAELASRYNEPEEVINSIASHHGDTPATSVIAEIVATADTLSAARPGSRSESLENYVKRLEKLEKIANDFEGVDHSYAIQAGREIRVMVEPATIDDAQAIILARDIKNKIEKDMDYPGNIKVTVIRETRAIDYAK